MARSFTARLLGWYDRHSRDARNLPWRGSRDPWKIWVSEVMLQQTRAEVVREAFPRFISSYPTPASWADASDDELLQAWRGLGYYRRARLLQKGAAQVIAEHDGILPKDPESLGRLAGIGEYTRGAIASIAFSLPEAAIDGNVERVLARHAAIEAPIKQATVRRKLRSLVSELIDRDRPGDFNQALMDLGALICRPRDPDCPICPLRDDCRARELGRQAELPILPTRRPMQSIRAGAVLVSRPGGRVLAARIPRGEINEGQVELPGPGILVDLAGVEQLRQGLDDRYRCRFQVGERLAGVRHCITNHKIVLSIHAAQLSRKANPALETMDPRDQGIPWTTVCRKALRTLL